MGEETKSFAVIFLLSIFLLGNYWLWNYITKIGNEKTIVIRLGIKDAYQGVVKNIQLGGGSLCISIAGVEGLIENPYPGIDYISIVEEGDSIYKIANRNECILVKSGTKERYLVQNICIPGLTEAIPFPHKKEFAQENNLKLVSEEQKSKVWDDDLQEYYNNRLNCN